jgi:hypothetical protein
MALRALSRLKKVGRDTKRMLSRARPYYTMLLKTGKSPEVPTDLIAREFGSKVAELLRKRPTTRRSKKAERKRRQVAAAHKKSDQAKMLKLADKTSNLRVIAFSPSPSWSARRRLAALVGAVVLSVLLLQHSGFNILAKRTDVLSQRVIRIVSDLADDWRQLDDRIKTKTDEIETPRPKDAAHFFPDTLHNYRYTTTTGIVPIPGRFLDRFELLCVRHAPG